MDNSRRLIAIDPGEKHVGVAIFERDTAGLWSCTATQEFGPSRFVELFDMWTRADLFGVVVFERFILEPGRAPMLAGSEMETSQMIGVIKYLVGQTIGGRVNLIGQTNQIKRPALAWAKSVKYQFTSVREGSGGHCKDAELHGVYAIARTIQEPLFSAVDR